MSADKVIITCALTGVLTDPKAHPVPVSTGEMVASAKEARNAGASILHLHYRRQEPGLGHLPSWEPDIVEEMTSAVRSACPGVIINMSTGVVGPDVSGPIACLARIKPEMAAANAGTLNYLKTRADGSWAWPPMVFDNPVEKVRAMLDAMREHHVIPELECFDIGIVRSVGLYVDNGMLEGPHYNFVMGVASGMPADAELLPLLLRYKKPESPWQATLIGREEIWPVHQRAAELGGHLRTGLEDTFYLPDGRRARGNGELVGAMALLAREVGRSIASATEARQMLGLSG
jgi:3-keto-5-aminohexanoate cleavage enzyme